MLFYSGMVKCPIKKGYAFEASCMEWVGGLLLPSTHVYSWVLVGSIHLIASQPKIGSGCTIAMVHPGPMLGIGAFRAHKHP